MEELDKALAREGRRLNANILEPAHVGSLDDIKRLVAELDPRRNLPSPDIELSTLLTVPEDGGKSVTYKVSALTKSRSKRDILIDGLTLIKNRVDLAEQLNEKSEPIEIDEKLVKPATFGNSTQGSSWVDPLIRQWLGGYRDGLYICWDLGEGSVYRYDVFQHRLTRVTHERDTNST